MGSMHAAEFAEAVADAQLGIDVALHWHLTANHFPPISPTFIPAAKEAIERANGCDWTSTIEMPNGRSLTVAQIIEGMHLDSFVECDEC